MTRKITTATLCLALAACGGGGNAALEQKFAYDTPVPASSDQLAALSSPLSDALAFQGTQDTSAASGFTDVSQVTDALLGSLGMSVGLDGTAARTALTIARQPASSYLTADLSGFDDPLCVTRATGRVTFAGCTVDLSDTDTTGKIGVNGSVSSSASGTLDWNLTVTLSLTMTGTPATVSASLHRSGHLSVAPGAMDGNLLQEISVTASASGQSQTIAVDEAVTIAGLTWQTTPAQCITSGSVTASRVWTQRPSGAGVDMANRSVVVTWTGCGTGTVAFSRS